MLKKNMSFPGTANKYINPDFLPQSRGRNMEKATEGIASDIKPTRIQMDFL